ncbi:uncharacterized protein [Periplaneta americana]|uniref:uncharacterized protein n=1 Tax=Periplaneta americana TaxID=6978 RepID=UPI0037E92ED6
MGQFTNLYGQITPLCTRLQDGNITLRYHLTVCKAIPYLRDLESVIDRFTNCNQGMITDSLAQESSTCGQNSQGEARNDTGEEDLSVFQNVVKLLTGELLGHEDCLDPHPTIRPIVSHQLPEIPKSAYINPYLSAYNAQTPVNYSSFWNDENMLNRIPFGYATPQLSGGYLSHYYPSTFHQYSNYNRNDYERTIISGNTVKNQVKETEISKNINGQELENDENRPQIINQNPNIGGNLRRDTNIGIQKKLPDKTLKQNNGNTVSVFVLNKTQCSVFQNASGNSKESIAKTRRTRLKRMTSSLRRNMTQNIRFLPNPPPEANDLPPIKIPTLKDNLLTPLS